MHSDAERMQLEIVEGTMMRIEALVQQALAEPMRPSVLFKPALTQDGNQWCMLYGENLQTGVAAFGKTPAEAAAAFDSAWVSEGVMKS